ncbi:MAG TPA: PilX N-terminal domain-containing pilus assembly protein [Phycisphaerales bacterium]|nr:PilX N-terminal domain-containing pilus assembly protein [Phycisphaerales bacterium]
MHALGKSDRRPPRLSTRRHHGIALAVVIVVLAMLNLVVMGSVRPAGDEALMGAMRAETTRAFYAAESGAFIAVRAIVGGLEPPAVGSEQTIGVATVAFVGLPPTGEVGEIVVEGRSGEARRRLNLLVE